MIFQADIGVCGQKLRQPQQEGQNYHNKEERGGRLEHVPRGRMQL